jgi:hypothetical protein
MILDGATLLVRYDTLARHARQLERELAEAVAALLLVSGAIDRLHEIVRGDVHSEGEIIFVVNNAQNAARAILARYKE